jgi:hypothetical protein
MSLDAPGADGTINLMGFVGYALAAITVLVEIMAMATDSTSLLGSSKEYAAMC